MIKILPWIILSLVSWLNSASMSRRNDKFSQNWKNSHKLKGSKTSMKRHTYVTESPIHYIVLPPNPYTHIPGVGFLSPPLKHVFPSLSSSSMKIYLESFEETKELQEDTVKKANQEGIVTPGVVFINNGRLHTPRIMKPKMARKENRKFDQRKY